MFIKLILCAVIPLLLIVNQFDSIEGVKIDHVGIRVLSVPSKNVKNVKVFNMTNKNGDRTFGGSFTLLRDLTNNLVMNIKTYFDRKGKIIPTPVKMSPNICEAFEKNTLKLRSIFDSSNLSDCPIKAGSYKITNWIPDENEIPSMPPGRYQVDFTFVVDNEEYATFRWMGGIVR
ncbi:uncharacterized protein [Atheta coriaria]|uniref:uncharacterized protein n=1 Tax=Dalotia coriaria TaxID=877792 RepID=UPI0031F43AE0